MRNTIINTITAYAQKDKSIFMVTGDAGFGVLDEYKRRFPDRFLNLGVAEQNAMSFSSGLALAGYKVFVYNIVPFLMYRCYEQVRNDICYQKLPVTLIGIGSGVTYAPQGMTHYSVEDVLIARTLPNLSILSPADPVEAEKCAEYALKNSGPVYIRIAKSGEPVIHRKKPESIERPILINKGEGVAVLFYGSIGIEVIKALADMDKKPLVASVPMIQPFDFKSFSRMLRNIHTIITVEEHFVDGGLGTIIADWLTKQRVSVRLIKLGIRNEFIHAIKNNAGMREKYGISSSSIRTVITEAFRNG